MATLIARVRILINDTLPLGSGQVFTDNDIEGVLDEGREDLVNAPLTPKPTFTGATIQYLNYYYPYGGWESDYVLKQYLTITVTPSAVEEIAGHFTFSSSTLPPVYVATGKLHDVYRASADLLERWAARWVLSYDVLVGGQQFKRSQATDALLKLAKSYRQKQRPKSISMVRSDLTGNVNDPLSLKATPLDYMASGNGNG
jgi:hypothetical protein